MLTSLEMLLKHMSNQSFGNQSHKKFSTYVQVFAWIYSPRLYEWSASLAVITFYITLFKIEQTSLPRDIDWQHGGCWWPGAYSAPGHLQPAWLRRTIDAHNQQRHDVMACQRPTSSGTMGLWRQRYNVRRSSLVARPPTSWLSSRHMKILVTGQPYSRFENYTNHFKFIEYW